jgi:hypothetical protein
MMATVSSEGAGNHVEICNEQGALLFRFSGAERRTRNTIIELLTDYVGSGILLDGNLTVLLPWTSPMEDRVLPVGKYFYRLKPAPGEFAALLQSQTLLVAHLCSTACMPAAC